MLAEILPPVLTARQQRLVDLADTLAGQFARHADQHEQTGTFPHQNYRELHRQGYLRLAVPADQGGEGVDLFELVLAQEHLARGDGATAMAVDMTLHLMGRLAETRAWPEPVFAAICRSILDDGALINSAATEPEMGSPSRGGLPATTATPTENGWHINGHKTFVTMAPALHYILVSVALPPTPEAPQGSRAGALLRADAPGVRMEDTWSDSLSLRTSGSYDIFFEDVFVEDAWLIDRQPAGTPPDPLLQATQMAWFTLSLAAVYLGIGQAACTDACAYARQRTPTALGRPIATLPNIQQRVGAMQASLTAARAVLHQIARAWVEQPAERAAMLPRIALAKYLCTNAAIDATDQALRIAGGAGLTRSLPLERYYRDVRAGLTHPPNDDTALEMVGRAMLDTPRHS